MRERDGDVAILTLNRPQARNSLSEALLIALSEALSEIGADKTVRAVVLAANGTAFCAGHDMKELTARRADADGGRAYFSQIMTVCSGMMQMIVNLPQPVIAADPRPRERGRLPTGCELRSGDCICGCQVRDAGRRYRIFCSTPMVALSRNVARKHAMEMLLTGEMVAADDAARIGLINRVVAAGEERQAAVALAKQIASKSSYVLKIGKQAFYRQVEMGLAAAYAFASEVMTENMMARDAEEGIVRLHREARAKMAATNNSFQYSLKYFLTA